MEMELLLFSDWHHFLADEHFTGLVSQSVNTFRLTLTSRCYWSGLQIQECQSPSASSSPLSPQWLSKKDSQTSCDAQIKEAHHNIIKNKKIGFSVIKLTVFVELYIWFIFYTANLELFGDEHFIWVSNLKQMAGNVWGGRGMGTNFISENQRTKKHIIIICRVGKCMK